MKYLLDTNACIQFITGRSVALKEIIENTDVSFLFICSVVRGELEYGARKSNDPEKTLSVLQNFLSIFPEISYDSAAAKQYGIIRADLEKREHPLVLTICKSRLLLLQTTLPSLPTTQKNSNVLTTC